MPNPLEGVDQSNDPYIIVSSDTHAGLYVEDYRAYLESSVHAEFDEWLQTRHEHRAMVEEMNGEYVEQWERENEWGLQGAYDPEIRDKALDADGIAGEVIFADGDAVTGMEAPPFGAGLHAGAITDPSWPGPAPEPTTAGSRSSARSNPPRRRVALVPITHGVEESVKEIYALADKPGIKGIMIPTMWHDAESYGHEKYDPIWQACHETGLVVHTHSGEADAEAYNENMAQYMLEVALLDPPSAVAVPALGEVRQVPELQVRAGRVRVVVARRPPLENRRDVRWHQLEGEEDELPHQGPHRAAAVGVRRRERLHRCIDDEQGRAAAPLCQRHRRASCGAPITPSGGLVAQHQAPPRDRLPADPDRGDPPCSASTR